MSQHPHTYAPDRRHPTPLAETGAHPLHRTARPTLERTLLSGTRALLWLAERTVPLCAALTRADVHIVARQVPYLPSGRREHLLDVYRPARLPHDAPLPVVLYVHGGAFEICSKDTHWLFAQAYARAGLVVFNINYRLAPEHPFPAALEDVSAAYAWVREHAHEYGGDAEQLVLAGESAGANLVTSLSLMGALRRPEPWAQRVYELPQPRAVVAACGLFDITRSEWFAQREPNRVTHGFFDHIRRAYLPSEPTWKGEHDLANPLQTLERETRLARPLPPMFVPVGQLDPLLEETRRLERALAKHAAPHEVHYYRGEIHAFHAMVWRDAAQECWRRNLEFIERHVARRPAASVARAA